MSFKCDRLASSTRLVGPTVVGGGFRSQGLQDGVQHSEAGCVKRGISQDWTDPVARWRALSRGHSRGLALELLLPDPRIEAAGP